MPRRVPPARGYLSCLGNKGLGGLCLGRTRGFEVRSLGLRARSAPGPLLCTLRTGAGAEQGALGCTRFPPAITRKAQIILEPQIHSKQELFLFTRGEKHAELGLKPLQS